jgi:hypothetical protein
MNLVTRGMNGRTACGDRFIRHSDLKVDFFLANSQLNICEWDIAAMGSSGAQA